MKKYFLFIIISFAFSQLAHTQDIITLRTGDELKGRVLRLTKDDVVFVPQGVNDTISMLRQDVRKLTYKYGAIVYLSEERKYPDKMSAESDSLYFEGQADANLYYKGYKGASVGTLVAGLVFPFNLIPAIACSATPPADQNLGYRDSKLMENPDYNYGYKQQAHKIKKKKVWTNFGIGTAAVIGLYVLSSALMVTTTVY